MQSSQTYDSAFSLLNEIRTSKVLYGEDGSEIPHSASLLEKDARCLYDIVRQLRPHSILEVGMEYADSTLSILQGCKENGFGRVKSIDPFQRGYAKGGGLQNIKRARLDSMHEWIEDKSEFALPRLLSEKYSCEFAFIDGNHLFDQTVLEMFYIDRMLPVGGIMALHDHWMASIKSASSWLETNRKYVVIPFESPDLRILQKTKHDERIWNFFNAFNVAAPSEAEEKAKY